MRVFISGLICLACVLIDRTLGALIGHRCEMCEEYTLQRVEDNVNRLTWCLPCTDWMRRRFGL